MIAGRDYSLDNAASPDQVAALTDGSANGIEVVAPDGTVTDAVGDTTARPGFSSGTPLPTVGGPVSVQYAFIRNFEGGALYDSGSNAADFVLMSADGSTIGGQPSAIGSPTPQKSSAPTQQNRALQSTLIDPGVAEDSCPNRCVGTDTLSISRTVANDSTTTYTDVAFEITALSQQNGAPLVRALNLPDHAWLTAVDPSGASVCTTYGLTCTSLSLSPSSYSQGGFCFFLTGPSTMTRLPGHR